MPHDRIYCSCCSEETEHLTIKSGQENLIMCIKCNEIHPFQKEREKFANIKVIVNKESSSETYHLNVPINEELNVGTLFQVDVGSDESILTEITSLETDLRTNRALAKDTRTIWTRAIDEVVLKVSVFRKGKTKTLRLVLPGNELCEIGETWEHEGTRFKVNKIKLRGQGFAKKAEAKDIRRVWGRNI
jgi:uncharacterized Zn finger protein